MCVLSQPYFKINEQTVASWQTPSRNNPHPAFLAQNKHKTFCLVFFPGRGGSNVDWTYPSSSTENSLSSRPRIKNCASLSSSGGFITIGITLESFKSQRWVYFS